jgi:hypothetical protein
MIEDTYEQKKNYGGGFQPDISPVAADFTRMHLLKETNHF